MVWGVNISNINKIDSAGETKLLLNALACSYSYYIYLSNATQYISQFHIYYWQPKQFALIWGQYPEY